MKKCDICGEPVGGKFSHHKSRDENGKITVLNGHLECIRNKVISEQMGQELPIWVEKPFCREMLDNVNNRWKGANRPPKPNIKIFDFDGVECRRLSDKVKELFKKYDSFKGNK